ncbi:MAG: hypothetical protein K1X94_22665 [Sandaracinaceae bacterium]|nr:hypothetical protein [Sandaracinaceae bacterium]
MTNMRSMHVRVRSAAVWVVCLLVAGCGAERLDGTWISHESPVPGGSLTTLALEGDGTLSLSIEGTSDPLIVGDCTGTASVRGMRWSNSLGGVLHFEGSARCEGEVTCVDPTHGSTTLTCHDLGLDLETGSCDYLFEDQPSTGLRYVTFTPCEGGFQVLLHQSFTRP